jgi:hypothetical protein
MLSRLGKHSNPFSGETKPKTGHKRYGVEMGLPVKFASALSPYILRMPQFGADARAELSTLVRRASTKQIRSLKTTIGSMG